MSDAARSAMQLGWEVEQFLYREADLLDERRYDEWLELLDEAIRYRAPIARNLKRGATASEYTGEDEIAWFDEGKETLRQRVRQIQSGCHWIEEPQSRVSHLVTNVRIIDRQPDPAASASGFDADLDSASGSTSNSGSNSGSSSGSGSVMVRSRILVYQNRQQTETVLLVGKRLDTLRRAGDDWRIVAREIHLDQAVLGAKALSVFF